MPDDAAEHPLVFLPLGGCGEIGMNLNAYGYGPEEDRRWILVDMGVTFGGLDTPGIDLIMPDPEYLIGEQIDAVFLTHAHEDHIGAVGLLYPRLKTKAPIYATPFTAELVKAKLDERGGRNIKLKTIPLGATVEAGPFKVQYVTLTHSIPEPNALSIETPSGTILHTGDWKIDPDPVVGGATDIEGLTEIGDRGVLAMVCDSTNVFEEGESGSEASVRDALTDLVKEQTGRVVIATFASNVARVASVIAAAEAAGRTVCLAGRSMHRITDAAKATGILPRSTTFVDERDANSIPRDNLLILCTGSQGEPRAALSRMARGDHRNIKLDRGDVAIFSSRVIPGNESQIYAMQNDLAEMGVRIITPRMVEAPIHVSGHPCRDELARMYGWVRPQIAVPVHGEVRHLEEHAAFAKSLQVPSAYAPRNGHLVQLAPGSVSLRDEVPAGRLWLDGSKLVPAGAQGVAERIRLAETGLLSVSVFIDEKGEIVDGPVVSARGFSEIDGRLADESLDALDEAAEEAADGLKRKSRMDDDAVERAIGRAVSKAAYKVFGRRATVDVMVLRG